MSFLAQGKKVDYVLFRLAQNELGDYLLTKIEDALKRMNDWVTIASVISDLSTVNQLEINTLCDPELVEENFGAQIRNGIKARFNEVLRTTGSQGSTSSQSTSLVKEQSTTTS